MRMAAVNAEGKLVSQMLSEPTGTAFSPEQMRENLVTMAIRIEAEIGAKNFAGLGIGSTGFMSEQGIVASDFIPLLNGVNLMAMVSESLQIPVKIENDARCFVLAEARFGAAQGCNHVVGLTLGTGVGGGVIVDGKIVHGAHRYAGEVWGIPLRGKWMEYFVSGVGIVRTFTEKGGNVADVDAAQVAELARGGNEIAQATFDAFAEDLWALCETLRSLLDPEVVVIGGSIALARDVFGAYFQRRLAERGPKVVWAGLGTEAGVIGAASLLMNF